jgi:hypothetical protein
VRHAMIRHTFKILLVLFVVLLVGCQPSVRFEEPQPKGKKDLNEVPKYYMGEYLQVSDSSILIIDSNIIYREWKGDFNILKSEMKEVLDTIYEEDIDLQFGSNYKISIDTEGDSAFISYQLIDTIFIIGEEQILRKYKGYLFLNYKKDENSWKVDLLKLENGYLDFDDLVSSSEIDTLKEIVTISAEFDSTSNKVKRYELNPKRRELKEILNRKEMGKSYIKL